MLRNPLPGATARLVGGVGGGRGVGLGGGGVAPGAAALGVQAAHADDVGLGVVDVVNLDAGAGMVVGGEGPAGLPVVAVGDVVAGGRADCVPGGVELAVGAGDGEVGRGVRRGVGVVGRGEVGVDPFALDVADGGHDVDGVALVVVDGGDGEVDVGADVGVPFAVPACPVIVAPADVVGGCAVGGAPAGGEGAVAPCDGDVGRREEGGGGRNPGRVLAVAVPGPVVGADGRLVLQVVAGVKGDAGLLGEEGGFLPRIVGVVLQRDAVAGGVVGGGPGDGQGAVAPGEGYGGGHVG